MADKSSIEWTDATWNPIRGCTRISPGCKNCYAERMAARKLPGLNSPATGNPFAIMTPAGPRWTGDVELIESKLDEPLHWKKPRRIFVNSVSDTFHADVPDEWIEAIFGVMSWCSHHTFIILTKRADRMRKWFETHSIQGCQAEMVVREIAISTPVRNLDRGSHDNINLHAWPLPNVWLGVSVEDQQRAAERIPHLLATPAAVRFLSVEPLLGPVDLREWMPVHDLSVLHGTGPDWVIVGGESGPGARPMHPDWVHSIRNQCQAAGVPFFFKQWGAWQNGSGLKPANDRVLCNDGMLLGMDLAEADYGVRSNWRNLQPTVVSRVGKKEAGRFLDGRTWDEMPGVRHA